MSSCFSLKQQIFISKKKAVDEEYKNFVTDYWPSSVYSKRRN